MTEVPTEAPTEEALKDEVRIITLPPLRVASVLAFGKTPEEDAWQKLSAWAAPRGFLGNPEHRIFGFNNPSPAPGSPNYGYEFWMTVGPQESSDEHVEVKEVPGGLYAVMRCAAGGDPYATIPAAWRKLVAWREASPYTAATHQWLEEHLLDGPNVLPTLELYLPIAR